MRFLILTLKMILKIPINLINCLVSVTKKTAIITFCLLVTGICSSFLPDLPNVFSNPLVRETVTKQSVATTVLELDIALLKAKLLFRKNIDIDINSNGGSVIAGHDIVQKLLEINNNGISTTCFVNRAFSMGFTILQFCTKRVVVDDGLLMQHMIHQGYGRERVSFDTKEEEVTFAFLDRVHAEQEAYRLGVSSEAYSLLFKYSKWFRGGEACFMGAIDFIYHKGDGYQSCASYINENKKEYNSFIRSTLEEIIRNNE